MVYKTEYVLKAFNELFERKKRPLFLADFKEYFGVREKRESKKSSGWRDADKIEHALRRLFKKGKLSRSESMVKIENYPVSPYASVESKNVRAYLYAPVEYAGKTIEFTLNGKSYSVKFVSYEIVKDKESEKIRKKDLVLEILRNSERALTVDEILERLNEKYRVYRIESKRDFYNATSSLTRAVLKPLRKDGLKGRKIDGKWVWYFTEGQLENYREHYIRNNEVLRTVRDLVKSEKVVPVSRIVSELYLTPEEVRYHVRKVAKCIEVEINVESSARDVRVDVKVPGFKRDSFIDWLGYVVPKSESGYGYESFLVDLDSDWEERLKKEIAKSLSRMNIRAVIGNFYEKLVARLFEILCSSEELRRNPELSKFSIPFVFRDERVANVWVVTESGRKLEFDVLIRGTFYAFNVMTDGRQTLDVIIPVESKYTLVKPEHVTNFDERIRAAFGDSRNVFPIMIGLGWSNEALHMAKRLGIMTLYFSAIDRLISEMTGKRYRHEEEWKIVEEMLNKGEITLKELRERLKKGEWRFEFERDVYHACS